MGKIFYLESTIDGKTSEWRMIVNLTIFGTPQEPFIDWHQVSILPEHDKKKVLLRAGHFSNTADMLGSSIKNVLVEKDSFRFQILIDNTQSMLISGTKNANDSNYSIEGVGFMNIGNKDKINKVEWHSTDKEFVLPYKEVY